MKGGEAYRVLARKYRPQTFDDLIGQEPMVRTVRNAFDAGRIRGADVDSTRRFIDEMPVTTSNFRPQFSIRGSFLELYRKLALDRIPTQSPADGGEGRKVEGSE